jgi:hypothetical protein
MNLLTGVDALLFRPENELVKQVQLEHLNPG